MIVVYADEVGMISVEVDTRYNIVFIDDFVFFDGADNQPYKIPVKNLKSISKRGE